LQLPDVYGKNPEIQAFAEGSYDVGEADQPDVPCEGFERNSEGQETHVTHDSRQSALPQSSFEFIMENPNKPLSFVISEKHGKGEQATESSVIFP
jgi:hypothetical protein